MPGAGCTPEGKRDGIATEGVARDVNHQRGDVISVPEPPAQVEGTPSSRSEATGVIDPRHRIRSDGLSRGQFVAGSRYLGGPVITVGAHR
jgi:hypothetical protein